MNKNYGTIRIKLTEISHSITTETHLLDGDALYITAKVKAADNAVITINGKEAKYDEAEHTYSAEIPLYNYRNTLCAIDTKNGYRAEIVVFWLKNATDKFYFTVDDCVVFLYELTKYPEKYPSLFDHHFLAPFILFFRDYRLVSILYNLPIFSWNCFNFFRFIT